MANGCEVIRVNLDLLSYHLGSQQYVEVEYYYLQMKDQMITQDSWEQ